MQTKEFKYVTEDQYNEFVLQISKNDDSINNLIGDPRLMKLLNSRVYPNGWNEEKSLPTVETLLNYFELYEEYEICQMIINAWPELQNKQ